MFTLCTVLVGPQGLRLSTNIGFYWKGPMSKDDSKSEARVANDGGGVWAPTGTEQRSCQQHNEQPCLYRWQQFAFLIR